MSNITENWKRIHEKNSLDSKSIERLKRSILMLQDTNELHLNNGSKANFGDNLLVYNISERSRELPNRTNNSIDNEIEVLSAKELIDLALSAFGMNYHSSAGKFLKEAAFSLGMQQV